LLGLDAESQAGAAIEPKPIPAPQAPPKVEQPAPVLDPPKPIPVAEAPAVAPARNGNNYSAHDYGRWTPAQKAVRLAVTAGFKLLGRVETEGLENIPEMALAC